MMKKILAVMIVMAALFVCGAAVAEKTKKVTKTTTQKGPKTVWLTDMPVVSRKVDDVLSCSDIEASIDKTISGVLYDRALLVHVSGGNMGGGVKGLAYIT